MQSGQNFMLSPEKNLVSQEFERKKLKIKQCPYIPQDLTLSGVERLAPDTEVTDL